MPTIIAQCDCGAKYRVADSMAGRRVRCKKCGETFKIGDSIGEAPTKPRSTPQPAAPVPMPTTPPPASLSYAETTGPSEPTVVQFLPALFQTFLFLRRRGNIGTFFIAWGVLAGGMIGGSLLIATGYLRPIALGILVLLLTEGSFAAFCFETVRQAAEGEEDLPTYPLAVGVDEWWSMLFVPFFAYLGTSLLVLAPVIVCLMASLSVALAGVDTSPLGDLVALFGSLGLGLFAWPMLILCVSMGGAKVILRVHPILLSIFRTFGSYSCTVLVVYISAGATIFIVGYLAESETAGIIVDLLGAGLRVFFQTAAMLSVGAYYQSHRERLSWMLD